MKKLSVPKPDLQIAFYHRLQELRTTCLLDALLATVANLPIAEIDRQLSELVSEEALRKLAGWGLRGEILFAVPRVLEPHPALLGYYRLLLGFSQKEFYGSRHGLGPFKSMEEAGKISMAAVSRVRELCQALCESAEFLASATPELSPRLVHDLTLLTLGPQLRGGTLNALGATATRAVFGLIKSIVSTAIIDETKRSLELHNAAGRTVTVVFANDPDVCLREKLASGNFRELVAIEIKGGRDYSNVHNRIGEAEKSHQKAKRRGFVECWTIVGVKDLDFTLARRESPTTDRFYHLDRILELDSEEARDFRENLLSRTGIVD